MIRKANRVLAAAVVAALLRPSLASAAPTALAPDTLPDEASLPRSHASSVQLLTVHVTNSDLEVSRGGVIEPDLLVAVSGSSRAEELARSAQRQIPTGNVIMYSGLGLGFAGLAIDVASLITRDPASSGTSPAVTAAVTTSILVGLVLVVIGAAIGLNGYHDALDAVSAYNDDLVDGRLSQGPTNREGR